MPKIKLDKDIYDKVKIHVEKMGYSSVDEFIRHCIEKELESNTQSDSDQTVKDRLKGLGYI